MYSRSSSPPRKKGRRVATTPATGANAASSSSEPSSLPLLEATHDRPWLVEATAVMPDCLQRSSPTDHSDSSTTTSWPSSSPVAQAVATYQCRGWTCLVSHRPLSSAQQQQHTASVGYRLHIWFTPPNSSLKDQIESKAVLHMTHAKWEAPMPNQEGDNLPLLVALQPLTSSLSHHTGTTSTSVAAAGMGSPSGTDALSSTAALSKDDTIFLYTLQPRTGSLLFWRLGRSDIAHLGHSSSSSYAFGSNTPPPRCSTTLPLDGTEYVTSMDTDPVGGKHLIVGTSHGRLLWIRQVQNTVQIHPVPSDLSSGGSSSFATGSSLMQRLFGAATFSSSGYHDGSSSSTSHDHPGASAVCQALPFTAAANSNIRSNSATAAAANYFVAVTVDGTVTTWSALRPQEHTTETVFEKLEAWSMRDHVTSTWPAAHVLQAALAGTCLQVIVLAVLGGGSADQGTDADSDYNQRRRRTRLYWMRYEQDDGEAQDAGDVWQLKGMHWLDRFPDPERVIVHGLMVAENGVGYATFTIAGGDSTPILMALDPSVKHELDVTVVEQDARLLGLFADERTHGCVLWTTPGTLLRMECKLASENAAQQKQKKSRSRRSTSTTPPLSGLSRPTVDTLHNHLRCTFWDHWNHPDRTIYLPPSVERADASELEQAIFKLGQELQKQGGETSAASASLLEHHLFYIEFLQQARIYRSLKNITKWHLLSIGQEIAAYQALLNSRAGGNAGVATMNSMDQFRSSLTSFEVSVWLESVGAQVWLQGGGDDRRQIFAEWLEEAMTAALDYRKDRAKLTYDITGSRPPNVTDVRVIPLWTSKPATQSVLVQQLAHWSSMLKSKHQPTTRTSNNRKGLQAAHKTVEVVVAAALRSVGDAYEVVPSESNKVAYLRVQKMGLQLLRGVNGPARDAVAWSLCKEHAIFEGLCEIAVDHRRRSDEELKLSAALFDKFAKVVDLGTERSFGKFVLMWHIDKNRIGDALQYSKFCREDMLQLVEYEDRLRPYSWIISIRNGDYMGATDSLVGSVEGRSRIPLGQTRFNLAMAKLCNNVVGAESVSLRQVSSDREKHIENMRELANAQKMLFEGKTSSVGMWAAEDLLNYALNKTDKCATSEDKTDVLFTALTICATLESSRERKRAASEVWFKAISSEWKQLNRYMLSGSGQGDTHATPPSTVFGKLVEECDATNMSQDVGIDQMVEHFILEKAQREEQQNLQLILRLFLTK